MLEKLLPELLPEYQNAVFCQKNRLISKKIPYPHRSVCEGLVFATDSWSSRSVFPNTCETAAR